MFPALADRDFRGPEHQLAGFGQRPFSGKIEIRCVSGLIQSSRHFQRCSKRLDNCSAQLQHLFLGLMRIERAPDLCGKVEHRPGHHEFCFFKSGRCHASAQRDIENFQKIHICADFKLRSPSLLQKQNGGVKDWISQKPGLDQVGLGHSQLGVYSLEPPIVQKSNLHGLIDSELSFHQGANLLQSFFIQLSAAVPKNLPRAPFLDQGADLVKPSVKAHRRTAT